MDENNLTVVEAVQVALSIHVPKTMSECLPIASNFIDHLKKLGYIIQKENQHAK